MCRDAQRPEIELELFLLAALPNTTAEGLLLDPRVPGLFTFDRVDHEPMLVEFVPANDSVLSAAH